MKPEKITGIGRTLIETLVELPKLDASNEFTLYTNYDNRELLDYSFPPNVNVKSYPISKNRSIANLIFNATIFPFLSLIERADVGPGIRASRNGLLPVVRYRPRVQLQPKWRSDPHVFDRSLPRS